MTDTEDQVEVTSFSEPRFDARRRRMERLAWLLDNSIRIPVIGYRIGLDAILGLIPGIGDAIGAMLSGYIFYSAIRMKAPISVLSRMGLNILVELVVGMLPVLGDVFDAGFKANARNMDLINVWLQRPADTQRRSRLLLAGLSGGIGLLLVGGILAGLLVLFLVIRLVARVF